MKSWVKRLIVGLSAVTLGISSVTPAISRPGEGDLQKQVRIDELTAKIKTNPKDYQSYLERADFYLQLKELDLCQSDAKSAISVRPTGATGYWLLAHVAAERKDYSGALRLMREFLKRGKSNAEDFRFETSCLLFLQKYEEAISRSLEISKQYPEDSYIHCYRAMARLRTAKEARLIEEDIRLAAKYANGDGYVLCEISNLRKQLRN